MWSWLSDEAHELLAPFVGDGIVSLAALCAALLIGAATLITLSPIGHAKRRNN
jgi:hypothetical protein